MESEKLLSGRISSESSFEDLDLGHQIRTRRTRRARIGKWALRVLVSWLTVWSIFNISRNLWKKFHKPQRVSCACGSSFAEARALNCRFDSLASAWLRPECIDEDLTAEFNRAGPEPDGSWTYYTDFDKTGTYTLDQIASLADTGIYYYNTQAWHLAHCTFNWRKAIRSRWTGVVMEARSDTEEHVNHCEMMFKSRLPLEYVGVVSAITFDADWAGLKHEMHSTEGSMHMHEMHEADVKLMHTMHSMHEEDGKSMHNMHEDSKSMHEMHGDKQMHADGKSMHSMHDTDSKSMDMHPDNMHPEGAMHKATEDMHPQGGMMHGMHGEDSSDKSMHGSMHPEADANMHPSNKDMHANMHPSNKAMHGQSMHAAEKHPGMHPESSAEGAMHPSKGMHGQAMHASDMHPTMHPEDSSMDPEGAMHPTELA